MGSNPVAVTYIPDIAPSSSKELPDIQVTKEIHSKTRMWHDKNTQPKYVSVYLFTKSQSFSWMKKIQTVSYWLF